MSTSRKPKFFDILESCVASAAILSMPSCSAPRWSSRSATTGINGMPTRKLRTVTEEEYPKLLTDVRSFKTVALKLRRDYIAPSR